MKYIINVEFADEDGYTRPFHCDMICWEDNASGILLTTIDKPQIFIPMSQVKVVEIIEIKDGR